MKKESIEHNIETKLRDSEKDKFLTLSQDIFLAFDSNGIIRWSNPAFNSLFEIPPEQTLSPKITEFIDLHDKFKFEQYLNLQIDFNKALCEEFKLNIGTGGYLWTFWNSVFDSDNNLFYASIKDISSIKNSEEELQIINKTLEVFSESAKLEDALRIALQAICNFTGWAYGEAFIKDNDSEYIKRAASWFDSSLNFIEFDRKNSGYKLKLNNGLIGKVWNLQKFMWISNLSDSKEFLRAELAKEAGFNSLFIMPVLSNNETVSIMVFYQLESNYQDEKIIDVISTISVQLGLLIERKRIEDNLIESEKLLADTQKIVHIGSWEWIIEDDKIYWSDELFNIFGMKPQEHFNYNTFIGFFPNQEKDRMVKVIKKALDDYNPYFLENVIIRLDGEERALLWKGEVIQDESGNVKKIIGIAQDITVQKKSDELLKRSELYYRSLIENSLDVKTTLDPDGKIKFVSSALINITGYKPDEIVGKNILQYINNEDVSELVKTFNYIIDKPGIIASCEFRFKHKNGEYCYLEGIMKNLLNVEAVSGIIMNSRDITTKKSAEAIVKTLIAISEKLNSTLDVDLIMEILVIESMNLVRAENGNTGLKTAEGLTSKKYYVKSVPYEIEYCWAIGEGMPGKVLKDKLPYISNNVLKDPAAQSDFIKMFSIKNSMAVPIIDSLGEVIGFIEVNNKKDGKDFIEKDLEKLITLSQTAATAIQNALTYQKMVMTELQLKNSREQMRRLSAHLQSAREEERTRIAREIHDELGQALTGLKMDIAWLERKFKTSRKPNPDLVEKTITMANLVDSTIKTVRKISSELRPGVLDYLGLFAAIEWQAQDFQSRTGIICNITNLQREIDLDQTISTAVFRIFQETLTNVARHSKATNVEIKFSEEDDNIVLEISDNGIGIPESEIKNSKSFGLLGMRERTHLIGGEFNIKGSDKGTIVTVIIPIDKINETGEKL